ncbi:MAG: BsuBI/PstI family type II restriction endonuclease [Bacteroidales bacterium]|nr:BsuBI/PstI family type II restriction endonuclease [Bacteroidales bacterium]
MDIAWETEVWGVNSPNHMIHLKAANSWVQGKL